MPKRKYGRVFVPDERDTNYLMPPIRSRKVKKTWNTGPWNGDQGSNPSCVGYACAHFAHAEPHRQWYDPEGIYYLAKRCDEYRGEDYDGTSVRGGVDVLYRLKVISQYQWTWKIEDAVDHGLENGPLILGVNWYANMETPDDEGIITVGGRLRGGHAVLAYMFDRRRELVGIKNSWRTDWGKYGCAFISFSDLQRLFDEDGECCRPIEQTPDWK